MLDYRELLKKYMALVVREEGVTFVNRNYGTPSHMTEEEWEALVQIHEEFYA